VYSARYAAVLTTSVIGSALQTHAMASDISEDLASRSLDTTKQRISELLDDFCGTPPRFPKWPWPRPVPLPEGEPRPVDLANAGLAFRQATRSTADQALQSIFGEASQRLVDRALNVG
jgi:hypothetical protein